jgi:hypothetical protein
MTHYAKYLVSTLLVGFTAMVAAREMGVGNSLRLAFDAEAQRINGYAFQQPVGGSDVAPTIFVFSDNRTRYSRIGYRDKSANFRLRATFECMGDWSHEGMGNPEIRVGRSTSYRSASRGGGGKPIYAEGAPFYAVATVPLDDLQLPADLNPVHRCNSVVEDYSLQGKPPGGLLQKGFWIKVDNAVPASITPACRRRERQRPVFGNPPQVSAPGFETRLAVYIRCMPTGYVQTKGPPPRPGRPLSEYLSIKAVDLTAVNSPLRHGCPATVIFKGMFDAGRAIKGNYRLIGSDGYASSAYPFSLAAGATKSVSWQRRVELPSTIGGLTAGGSSSWPRPVTGWLQLVVNVDEANAEPRRSPRAVYRVDCLKPPSPQGTLKSNG